MFSGGMDHYFHNKHEKYQQIIKVLRTLEHFDGKRKWEETTLTRSLINDEKSTIV